VGYCLLIIWCLNSLINSFHMFICYKKTSNLYLLCITNYKKSKVFVFLLIIELHDGINIWVKKTIAWCYDAKWKCKNSGSEVSKNVCEREFFKLKKVWPHGKFWQIQPWLRHQLLNNNHNNFILFRRTTFFYYGFCKTFHCSCCLHLF